ncbi:MULTISPECIES: hypothetical protein [Sorangium]|uniref:Secreted protein n=1 Tax=Sorangium cellulosum TaxID=56 RepID=A0A4P2R3M5_SORCE|nr:MULTISPECIES: hypothetical protein [Sorangium]AUX37575.1 hypothetical protein SOCE836_098040 [Sorangium cellulosum]WCQ96866.1 hypothetical protein NQZ70_09655 [Sorangium sp. Soce836]
MPTAGRPAASVAALLGVVLAHGTARAEPQTSVGVTLGVAGAGLERRWWDATAFHAGLRGDVLFGRGANDDFGIGPYAEVLTHGFDELQAGAGISALAPVLDLFPLIVSTGLYGRWSDDADALEPGIAAAVFWGARSYNFHSPYVMSTGLLAQMRLGLGASKETAIVLAAQLDVALLGLPFVYLFNVLTGPSPEAAPVRRAESAR